MFSSITSTRGQQALIAIVAIVTICSCSGCNRPISREALIGSYRMTAPAGSIDLELLADGSFIEVVRPHDSTITTRRGKWSAPNATSPSLGLDGLWIPTDFAPDYIREADRAAKSGPRFTEPGYWVGRPVQGFGRLVIPVFPDADLGFERVSTLNR